MVAPLMIRFVLVGLANTAFSYGIYALGLYLGLPYYLASFVALIFGICVSFLSQGKLVFRSRLRGRFCSFLTVWALLYLFNISLIKLFGMLGANDYLAGLIALVPVVALSFLLQRYVVFKSD
ncbi:GtrA family protein [Aliiroseovarius sp. KMU-50]|uniref:GtrA family protein n=1 Tax=Aliiroseovarius salicola TaxID=3009082 RepID=A0ABT4W5F6_9RHOB|nr:GtrA family protein [Aliiroseovarius sp. KMU-50]MDA5095743.1 GtrA family protein [Aliiroseovarius sp. KMU-50]